jgi:N-acetylglucosaminyldiphosphoundecaprenol N-acetyl-beta-D-mannosaminyltransferase
MSVGSSDGALTTYGVCGARIAALKPQEAAVLLVKQTQVRQPFQVHLCNVYTLSLVDDDLELAAALNESDLNLPDGTPVAWLGRTVGAAGPVRGPGLVGDTARLGVSAGVRHYFWGGKEGIAAAAAAGLHKHAPGMQVAGVETPPFTSLSDDDLDRMAERVRDSGANIVWVGLGTPRQDYAVPRLAKRLSMPIVPVGAAFDFWAGAIAEAPQWLHGTGLEWLHRLAAEPRRLWRRYLFGNPRFVMSAIRHARTGS